MKTIKHIGSLVSKIATNFLLAMILSLAVSAYVEVNPFALACVITASFAVGNLALGLAGNKVSNFAFMALQKDIWLPFIEEVLFPENKFLEFSSDHSAFIDGLNIHIPQAGATPGMVQNNTSVPLAVTQRTDTELIYTMNNYKLSPIVVTDLEELQISYDKMNSVTGTYFRMAGHGLANVAIYSWQPVGATRQVRLTGSATASALAPGATGTRNAITLADVLAAKLILDNDFVPPDDRYLLIPPAIHNQLLSISNVQAFYAYNSMSLQTGITPKLFGFTVLVRPLLPIFDNTGTPVIKSIILDTTSIGGTTFGTPVSPATTDNMSCFAFHKDFVSQGRSSVKLFSQSNVPQYYGNLLSAEVQFGSSVLRTGGVGTAVLIQQ